ncbi:CMRF35-like molecule 1 isoform X1 [Hemiscyllium ocellatum]|uniref:CMRF35-like molecule 1 isoform X1 n=1 Tax=Hemiscyllium ocellatum TaxID=170820 RepID=UPI00296618D0|nr:CMRF35-like molecule 1 isoform X1 [Hemiscyllium ocellatum]
MKYIVFLVLSLISTSWTQITWTVLKAAAGKSITVQFPWKWDQKHPVMWCKSYSETKCKVIVRIEKSTNNNFHGTTSISYIHGSISVTMEQLQEKNTGTYWCGAQKQGSIVVSDVILLKVFTDSEESIPTETYNVMQNTIIVSCLYTQQERHYKKFFCKVTSVNNCTVIASSDKTIGNEYKGRVLIMTNKSRNFTVTMSNITKADKGQYWCGSVDIDDVKITQVLTIANVGIPAISSDNLSNTTLQIWHIIIPALLGLLILSLLILFLWKRKGIKRAGNDVKNENPETPDMTTKSDRIMKDTVTYSNVTLQPSAQTTEDSGTYANLKDLKEQKGSIKINSSESVEYAALQFKS